MGHFFCAESGTGVRSLVLVGVNRDGVQADIGLDPLVLALVGDLDACEATPSAVMGWPLVALSAAEPAPPATALTTVCIATARPTEIVPEPTAATASPPVPPKTEPTAAAMPTSALSIGLPGFMASGPRCLSCDCRERHSYALVALQIGQQSTD